MSIIATAALSVDGDDTLTWQKAPDTLLNGASTIKLLTAITARDWIANLDDTITLTSADAFFGPLKSLQVGDTLTYDHMLHAVLMESNNQGAECLARTLGALIPGGGTASSRFYSAMHDKGTSLGFSGHVVVNAWGGGTSNRLSPQQLATLLRHIQTADPWLFSVAGALTKTISVTGGRTADIDIAHTIDPEGAVLLPEFLAGKTGTNGTAPSSSSSIVMAWRNPNDERTHITAVMDSDIPNRYLDLRSVMDEVIAATPLTTRRRGAMAAI